MASAPPNLIFLYLVKIKYVENIKKPLAVKIINQPSDSEIAICVSLKNFDDASRLKKTIKVIVVRNSTERRNLDLFSLFIDFVVIFEF